MKIIEALRWGERFLEEKRVENPRFDADILLGYVLGFTRDRLYLERERELTDEEADLYRSLIARRASRDPLQYILKRQEFMGLEFYVDERVLIPRADSEVLVEKVLEFKDGHGQLTPKILDVGTGSGALAISIAYYWPEAEVVGTDLSPDALQVARFNAERLGVGVEWREGDFLEPAKGELWDFIITNPPYVSLAAYKECEPEIYREPAMAFMGGEDGLDFYRRLAQEVRSLLKPDGKVLMEIGWDQAEPVVALFRKQGFNTMVFRDFGGRDRVVLAR